MLFKSSHIYSIVKRLKCCKKMWYHIRRKSKDPTGGHKMDRADLASAKHRNGFNCCQSVACVFADEVGIDESLLYKMGEGFGAGMGTTQGVCGALSGAAMLAGLVHSDGNTERAGMTKAKTTKAAAAMQAKFTERVGALRCIDIKTGNNGGMFTSCDECIRIAAEIVEENLGL
jgi:C_GCAxxG_C_C family probable redox protein